jgi:WD40 repeat protein
MGWLWDTATGKELGSFQGHTDFVNLAVFSADGKRVLSASGDLTARLWDAATGNEILCFQGHTERITSAVFLPGGKQVLSASADDTARLWDVSSGKELCQLISFRDSGWVVVGSDGRFDTNDLDEIKGLHWIMPDAPFTPLPVEIFMRDYYEPRLLARILAGETFGPIRSLAR